MTMLNAQEAHIESMPRKEYAYFLRRVHGLTFDEIGKRLGVCGARASQLSAAAERSANNFYRIYMERHKRIRGFPDDIYDQWIGDV